MIYFIYISGYSMENNHTIYVSYNTQLIHDLHTRLVV
jgi:hypothetical protein